MVALRWLTQTALASVATMFLAACPGTLGDEQVATPNLSLATSLTSKIASTIHNGEKNSLVVNAKNNDDQVLLIERIRAYLVDPEDHERVIRTLEPARFTTKVHATGEANLAYRFVPYLDHERVTLIVNVEFADKAGNKFSKTAYKETVSIVEPPTFGFDPQLWSIYLMFGVVALGLGYWAADLFGGSKPQKPKNPALAALDDARGVSGESADDWVPSHHQAPLTKKTKSAKKKSS
ncbi:hypothetical protein H4R34_001497 [Dimargaris verticillata]|uniref:Signal sequence receptor subunit alpha n=1 Tax=Dimargaris verticillata TaxID=2761393 RepID=A0A9W8EDR2_9FUNG|nr:hypothetical protein H4R34_001497 [Dimargaris verticillata]